jgi:hypothetical protein
VGPSRPARKHRFANSKAAEGGESSKLSSAEEDALRALGYIE